MATAVSNELGPYAKALVPIVVLVLAGVADRLGVDALDVDWETVAVLLVTSAGVWWKRNKPRIVTD